MYHKIQARYYEYVLTVKSNSKLCSFALYDKHFYVNIST